MGECAPVKTSNSDSYYRWVGDGNRVHPGSSYRDANSGDCDYRLTTNQPGSQFEPKRTFHRSKRMSLAAVCEQNHAVGKPDVGEDRRVTIARFHRNIRVSFWVSAVRSLKGH